MPRRRNRGVGSTAVVPPTVSNAQWNKGFWVLDQIDTLSSDVALKDGTAHAFANGLDTAASDLRTNGVSIRCGWNVLEPITQGVYDFRIFDAVRARYPTKKMAIRVMAGKHTPTWWRGQTFPGTPNDSGTGTTFPVPKPWLKSGSVAIPGNTTFVQGWSAISDQLINWAVLDGNCRIIHLSQYGHEWSELFYGDDLKNAWVADFGGTIPDTELTNGACADAVVAAHTELTDLAAAKGALIPNIAMELPMSGHGVNTIGGRISSYAKTKFPDPKSFVVQSNCWGASQAVQGFTCGRAGGSPPWCMFGVQAFATSGINTSNAQNGNKQGLTWSECYTQAESIGATYSEVYRETYNDAVDLAEYRAAQDAHTWAPTPSSLGI